MKKLFVCLFLCVVCFSCGDPKERPMGITISERRIIQSDGFYNNTPSVVTVGNGDWLLAYKKGPNHSNSPQVITRRSINQGVTWTQEDLVFDASGVDPTLALTPDGHVFLEFTRTDPLTKVAGAAYTLSDDNGYSWGPFTYPASPYSALSAMPTRVITVGGVMYASGFGPVGDGSFTASLWSSSNSSRTWSKISDIRQVGDAGINESTIEQVGTGFLSINRADDGLHTYGHVSSDMGATWGSQIDYTSQLGVLQLPQLLQIPAALLLFGRGTGNTLLLFTSSDNGTTFTNRTVLDTYTGLSIDGGYCWPMIRPDGKIFVVYYADSNNLREPDIKSLVVEIS